MAPQPEGAPARSWKVLRDTDPRSGADNSPSPTGEASAASPLPLNQIARRAFKRTNAPFLIFSFDKNPQRCECPIMKRETDCFRVENQPDLSGLPVV